MITRFTRFFELFIKGFESSFQKVSMEISCSA